MPLNPQQFQDYINSAKERMFNPNNPNETSINKGEASVIFQQAQELGLSPAQISQMIGDPAYSEDVVKNYIQTAYPTAGAAYMQQHGFGSAGSGTTSQPTGTPTGTTVGQTATTARPPTTTQPTGNAGGYLNTQVPGGVTTNTDYNRYPTPIPTAPNYEAAAQQQGEANLNAAKNTVALSNPNQHNPFGSQTYTIGPDGRPVQKQEFSADMNQRLFDLNSILPNVTQNIRNNTGRDLASYDFQDVMNLDGGFGMPERTTQGGEAGISSVAEALRSREAPRMERARQSNEADLIARGFNPGTEGWQERMDDVSRRENDFNLGLTALAGQEQSRLFGLDTENRNTKRAEIESLFNAQMAKRQNQVGETITSRTLPIQEYGSLVNAMTPQMPQFNQYQGATVDANPIFNAVNAKGLFDLGRYGTSITGELGTRGVDATKGAANIDFALRAMGL